MPYGAHTFKNYYFYYDYNKGFCEYGGTDIGTEGLLKYEYGDEYLQFISDNDGEVRSVLKRNNDIINVNYGILDYYIPNEDIKVYKTKNITLKIVHNKVFFVVFSTIEENGGEITNAYLRGERYLNINYTTPIIGKDDNGNEIELAKKNHYKTYMIQNAVTLIDEGRGYIMRA